MGDDKLAWKLKYYGGTPAATSTPRSPRSIPLSTATPGEWVWIDEAAALGGAKRVLRPGTPVRILSTSAAGSVTLAVCNRVERVGVGAAIAREVWVSRTPLASGRAADSPVAHLGELAVGQLGRVVGYAWPYRGYRGKLLQLGLAPGVEFVLRRLEPDGTAEIELAGHSLLLGKAETNALAIEPVGAS